MLPGSTTTHENRIYKATDALARIDYRESHLHDALPEPSKNVHCNVVFKNAVPLKDRVAYSQQFQAELVSLFQEWGVESFEGMYGMK